MPLPPQNIMSVSASRILAAVGVFLLATACNDALSPREVARTYVLRAVQGEPLPTQLAPSTFAYRPVVLADTLRLDGDGWGRIVRIVRLPESGASTPTVVRWDIPLRYEYDGSEFRGRFTCPPNADCIGMDAEFMGVLRRGGLRVESGFSARVPLEYERVSP